MSLWLLILVFLKFGFLCIGGGYMLVPFLTTELVDTRGVLTAEQFANLFSIAQVTPGPIGINAATYVGYTQQGVAGAILASIALTLPPFVMTVIAVYTLKRYENHTLIRGFLAGARPATVGLIAGALLIFVEMSIAKGHIPLDYPYLLLTQADAKFTFPALSWGALAIAVVMYVLQRRTKLSMTWLILLSALLGAFLCR